MKQNGSTKQILGFSGYLIYPTNIGKLRDNSEGTRINE